MKWVKRFFAAVGYLLTFIVVFTLFTQVIDNFITEDAMHNFAWFFGIYDAEGILDLYLNTAMTASALLAIGVTLLFRLYIRRQLIAVDEDTE
jgi:hypothetical protein